MTVTRWIIIRWFYSSSHTPPFFWPSMWKFHSFWSLGVDWSGSDSRRLQSLRPCFHRRMMQRDARGVISAGGRCLGWVKSDEQMTGCMRARLEEISLLIDSHFRMAKQDHVLLFFWTVEHQVRRKLLSFVHCQSQKILFFSGLRPN